MGSEQNKRRIALIGGAALLLTLAAHRPSADIRIIAHDAGDATPHQVKAAIDLGLLAVNLLVTWSGHRVSG